MKEQIRQMAVNNCSDQKEFSRFDLTNVSDECETLLRKFENWSSICYSSFEMYMLEANTFLLLTYRFLNAYGAYGWNEKRLDIQEPISWGYFSQLYRKLGIIKIPSEQIYPILVQYDSVCVSYTYYYMSLYGEHWFDADADEDNFLSLADEIISDEGYSADDRPRIEGELLDSYCDAALQRELTQEAFHLLLEDYQLNIDYETMEENRLLCDLGYSFYVSDEEYEPQTNLYLYRSHLLYQLWQQKKDDPLIHSLFEKMFCGGIVADYKQEIIYAIRVQSFSQGVEGRWVFRPDVLFAICVLTLQGQAMAKQSVKMQDAMQRDANWYHVHCKEEKGEK